MPTQRKYNTADVRYADYKSRKKGGRVTELQAKGLPPLPAVGPKAPSEGRPEVPTILGTARWLALTEQARHTLRKTHDEMKSYQQSRSKRWQQGPAGRNFQERLEKVSAILENLRITRDKLSEDEG